MPFNILSFISALKVSSVIKEALAALLCLDAEAANTITGRLIQSIRSRLVGVSTQNNIAPPSSFRTTAKPITAFVAVI